MFCNYILYQRDLIVWGIRFNRHYESFRNNNKNKNKKAGSLFVSKSFNLRCQFKVCQMFRHIDNFCYYLELLTLSV